MKTLFRLKNSPVEFQNISVKHDMAIDERAKEKELCEIAKEKELYEIAKENNKDCNSDSKNYFSWYEGHCGSRK